MVLIPEHQAVNVFELEKWPKVIQDFGFHEVQC